jgi:hypothetical protein
LEGEICLGGGALTAQARSRAGTLPGGGKRQSRMRGSNSRVRAPTPRAAEARRLALEDGETLDTLVAILADDTVGVGPRELVRVGLRRGGWREVDRGLGSLRATVPLDASCGCRPLAATCWWATYEWSTHGGHRRDRPRRGLPE